MRRLFAMAMLLGSLCTTCVAQEAPKVEVFAGYSYLRAYDRNFNGWSGSGTLYFTDHVGIEANASGSYFASETTDPPRPPIRSVPLTTNLTYRIHSYLIGPHIRYSIGHVAPFAHALFGVAHTSLDATANGPVTFIGLGTRNNFAMALGGGLDLRLNGTVSLRLLEADYYREQISSSRGGVNGTRLSFGLVFSFGNKHEP